MDATGVLHGLSGSVVRASASGPGVCGLASVYFLETAKDVAVRK